MAEIPHFNPENKRTFQEKILNYETTQQYIRFAVESGLITVLAQGVFDIVHIGHLDYLRLSREVGNLLFVGVETDDTVKLNKGIGRPYNSLSNRLRFLAELEVVDFVFPFNDLVEYGQNFNTYTKRFTELSPTIVTMSSWDPHRLIKEAQIQTSGITFKIVNDTWATSSTYIARLLQLE